MLLHIQFHHSSRGDTRVAGPSTMQQLRYVNSSSSPLNYDWRPSWCYPHHSACLAPCLAALFQSHQLVLMHSFPSSQCVVQPKTSSSVVQRCALLNSPSSSRLPNILPGCPSFPLCGGVILCLRLFSLLRSLFLPPIYVPAQRASLHATVFLLPPTNRGLPCGHCNSRDLGSSCHSSTPSRPHFSCYLSFSNSSYAFRSLSSHRTLSLFSLIIFQRFYRFISSMVCLRKCMPLNRGCRASISIL